MNKKFISVAMATLLVSGTISSHVVRGSDPEEPILLPLFSSYTNSRLAYLRHRAVVEKYKKIEYYLFDELKIQDLLISVLEADYSHNLIDSVIIDQKTASILHATILEPQKGNLYMARKYLFFPLIQLCLNPYNKSYKRFISIIEFKLQMRDFAQQLGPDRCKSLAKTLREDSNWLKNMMKLDFTDCLNKKMFKRY